jgi:hypothetical protein
MVYYLFRVPGIPVHEKTDSFILSASIKGELNDILKKGKSGDKDSYAVIDATGEERSSVEYHQALSPLTYRKKLSKKEIMQLVNACMICNGREEQYICSSISNIRIDQIVGELADFCKQL